MATEYAQLHPKVHPELAQAIKAFAAGNGLTMNRAAMHLLTLGLNTMNKVYGGSMLAYLNNTHIPEDMGLTAEEIHS